MTPQAVIFDIGNVLIEWRPERFYDRMIGEPRRRAFFAETDVLAMNEALDRGADFRETVAACAARHPDWAAEIRMWHDCWLELATPAIPHSVRLLRALRTRGVPVFALTNFGIGTWAVAEAAYPFLAEFDRHYISGHMGVIKPETRIYEMVEEECGIDPAALLFTDDRPENIAAAAARGWQVHRFDGPEGWEACLIAHGLLPGRVAA